jgi:lambda family phage portal protein
MNPLERAISVVAPAWGARRAKARALIRAYEAARQTSRNQHRKAKDTGPNAEVGPALRRLRNLSRRLIRDNPYAARIVEILTSHRVGYGISIRSATGDKTLDAQANAIWKAFARRADVAGLHSFDGLLELMARAWAGDGEGLMRIVRLTAGQARSLGLVVPLQLEVVEADLLDETLMVQTASGGLIVQGVELAKSGRRVAFHFRKYHPGEPTPPGTVAPGIGFLPGWLPATAETDRWPAADVLHLFTQARPGQQRGVPVLAGVATRMFSLEEYELAALEKAKIEACFAAFVTKPNAQVEGTVDPETGKTRPREEQLNPGMLSYLDPGESVEFAAPTAAGQFEPLAMHFLLSMGAGTGPTYDQVTGDLRKANFSSLRAGKIEFRRGIDRDHWLRLIPMVCERVWDAVMDAAVMTGQLAPRPGGYPCAAMPPRHEMIDPRVEGPHLQRMRRMGLATWKQQVQAEGYDPEEQMDELQEENGEFDRRGFVLDGDPRRTGGTGSAQDAKQNARVELNAADGGA